MVKNVKQKFSLLTENHGKLIEIFEKKNNGLEMLEKMSKIFNGKDDIELIDFGEFPDYYSSDDFAYFKYVPITIRRCRTFIFGL